MDDNFGHLVLILCCKPRQDPSLQWNLGGESKAHLTCVKQSTSSEDILREEINKARDVVFKNPKYALNY